MKLTALVENQSHCNLKATHGLALYIETNKHKLLFDLGPDNTIFENALKLGVDLSQVDTVIISHGHNDHGGALEAFIKLNPSSKIYIQEKAFDKHYSSRLSEKKYIGLNPSLKDSPNVILLNGDHKIDDELELFTVKKNDHLYSCANNNLYSDNSKDDFAHEQNLIIKETHSALIMGCAHKGVVNILNHAQVYSPSICVGGFHLSSNSAKTIAPTQLLDNIAQQLKLHPNITFYTCHCTGAFAFDYLSKKLPNLNYLSCGDTLSI